MGSGSLYVGIDGHKNFSFLCAMTKEGEIIEEKKVRNEEIEKIVEELGLDNLIVIIEPTTTTYPLIRGLRKKTEIKLATKNQIDSRIEEEDGQGRCQGFS